METPGKMDNQQLVSPSLPCSSPPVGVCQGFLSKEHPLYSPDLAAADFTCSLDWNRHWRPGAFVMLLISLRMRPEELKRLSRKGFRECLQHIYSRWQKCIVVGRYYFEGNVAELIVLLCIAQNILKLPRIRRLASFAVSLLIRSIRAPSCVAEWLAGLFVFTLA